MKTGFIALTFLAAAAFAGEVEVRMMAPTNTVYFDEEDYPFVVTVSNGTQRTYKMFAEAFSALRAQLYFELGDERETQRFTLMGVLPKKYVSALDYINTSTRGDIVSLPPGGHLVWDFGGIQLFDMSPLGTNQMRAVVLMGTNEWARSPLYPSNSQLGRSIPAPVCTAATTLWMGMKKVCGFIVLTRTGNKYCSTIIQESFRSPWGRRSRSLWTRRRVR